jgi:hypothetical protein
MRDGKGLPQATAAPSGMTEWLIPIPVQICADSAYFPDVNRPSRSANRLRLRNGIIAHL